MTDHIWLNIRTEAETALEREPLMEWVMRDCVLKHDSFEDALAFQLASKLQNAVMDMRPMRAVIERLLAQEPMISQAARVDLCAALSRDPACLNIMQPMLYFKGYQALQAHRLAHQLWREARRDLAYFIQMRCSELFTIDIHPGARIGQGVMIDHAHALVIGETAIVGNDVSMLHSVTLGGTGKELEDRHPKIGNGVLLGAGSKVLGNIHVGSCSRVAAGSVVLEDVPSNVTVAGVPAKIVGAAGCLEPATEMHHLLD